MSRSTGQLARNVAQSRARLAMLEKAGIDPREIGRVFNRAAPTATDPEDIKIPTDAGELESMLGDSVKMQKLWGNPAAFGEFVRNYARSTVQRDREIGEQVKNQTEAILTEWLKENEPAAVKRLNLDAAQLAGRIRAGQAGRPENTVYNPKALGAQLDADYAGAHQFFSDIWHQGHVTADMQARRTKFKNAFGSTVPSEGGFLIPETLRSELLRVSLETAIVRPRARVIPMETLRVPFPAIDSTSNVSSVYGGIVGYWTEEGAALTQSSATFGRVVLDAKKLTAYTEVPNELISDSGQSFEALIGQLFPEALGFYEDYAYLMGTGVGEPLGMLSADNASIVTVSAEGGQASGTIVWENIIKMFARMLPASLSRGIWIASIDTFPELATMALNVGTGGSAVWLNGGVDGPPAAILGRPVVFTEKASVLGTTGDISFVDPAFYLIGDRQAMSAMSSPHYKFGNDVTAYRIIERVDGRPWLQSAITPKNGGNTLSPFVKLATR